jgi:hypothetical protein
MFRFTIRDVLWLMVVVTMGVGWCVEHQEQRGALDAMRADRDEMKARWQDASKKWVDLYNMGPPPWPANRGGLGSGGPVASPDPFPHHAQQSDLTSPDEN